ncbi:MAG: non-canonical purine NTP pyrophosphatase, partial [Flavobacteriales bacterium]|nr:non-canonical purine NTP pyrophosphatase [Flavobacteriales bacterium]
MEADLVLCSGNPGKVEELRALLPGRFRLIGLADLGLPKDLPEDGATLYANAEQKARYVYDRCGLPCIADDSGLEVDALGGAPGVFSARYAGSPSNADANMHKLLAAMDGMAH